MLVRPGNLLGVFPFLEGEEVEDGVLLDDDVGDEDGSLLVDAFLVLLLHQGLVLGPPRDPDVPGLCLPQISLGIGCWHVHDEDSSGFRRIHVDLTLTFNFFHFSF